MTLQIVVEMSDEFKVYQADVADTVENWERVLRKMYKRVWKKVPNDAVDVIPVMINAGITHNLFDKWAEEYSSRVR